MVLTVITSKDPLISDSVVEGRTPDIKNVPGAWVYVWFVTDLWVSFILQGVWFTRKRVSIHL